MQSVFHLLFVFVINIALLIAQTNHNYEENIIFKVANTNETECANGTGNNKLAFVVHGWTESCDKPWAKNLISNLLIHRKGCVLCMDYSEYSVTNYINLKNLHFEGIVTQLTKKINDFVRNASFDPNHIFMFGFSLGAHVVFEAGKRFAEESEVKIKQIDVCEPTAVGFLTLQPKYRDAAQNVQCIHTSSSLGTLIRDCHQDWNMGECGLSQVGGSERVLLRERGTYFGNGSHGLCPVFYNAAFEHKFPAIPKPLLCLSRRRPASARYIANFSMGYLDALKYEGRFPDGKDFYAKTYKDYPFNEPVRART